VNRPSGKVVILDRDGTVVIDRGYLRDPEGLEFEPGAAEGLRALCAHGFRLLVITNQSGVGRGLFTLGELHVVNARLNSMIESVGARLEGIYFCPHAPDIGCRCRKPALGLLEQAAAELEFDPSDAVMVGDKESDIEFGRRAGATTVFVGRQDCADRLRVRPDVVSPTLLEAARAVISLRG
jgi:D-glycero-D-manno-heptose 1,7-bisphosphate phosphatase